MIVRRNIGNHPLVEYEWCDHTGIAMMTWLTREVATHVPGPDLVVMRDEPMHPDHRGWTQHGRRELKTNDMLREIGERADAMVEGVDANFSWQYL
jgi:hypothetical protein